MATSDAAMAEVWLPIILPTTVIVDNVTDWAHDLHSPRAARRCGSVAGGERIDAQSPAPRASADQSALELSRLVRGLTTTARVLVVGMHPDDEDTQLITWLSRARNVETAYLSITRGEAGVNFGGSESGNSLGAIRTEEVLAARRIDGAEQYFTRAYDFGSARNESDVLKRWNRDSIVGDIVAVIRSFRPQVIVAMLPDSAVAATVSIRRWSSSSLRRTWRRRTPAAFRSSRSAFRGSCRGSIARVAASRSRRRVRSRFGKVVRRAGDGVAGAAPVAGIERSHTADSRRTSSCADSRSRPATARRGTTRCSADSIRASCGWGAKRRPAVGEAILSIAAYADSAQRSLDLLTPTAALPFLAQITRLASTVRSALPWCRHPSPTAAPPVLPHGTCEPRVLDLDASIDLVGARAQAALLAAAGVSLEASADRDLIAGDDTVSVTVTMSNHGTTPVTLNDLAVYGSVEARMEPIVVPADSSVRVLARVHGLPDPHPWWIGSRGGPERGGDRFKAVLSSVDGLLQTDSDSRAAHASWCGCSGEHSSDV